MTDYQHPYYSKPTPNEILHYLRSAAPVAMQNVAREPSAEHYIRCLAAVGDEDMKDVLRGMLEKARKDERERMRDFSYAVGTLAEAWVFDPDAPWAMWWIIPLVALGPIVIAFAIVKRALRDWARGDPQ